MFFCMVVCAYLLKIWFDMVFGHFNVMLSMTTSIKKPYVADPSRRGLFDLQSVGGLRPRQVGSHAQYRVSRGFAASSVLFESGRKTLKVRKSRGKNDLHMRNCPFGCWEISLKEGRFCGKFQN